MAGRLSPTSDRRKILAVWMGKSRRPWGGKGKVVWPGGSRRRPMGDQDSLRWTGKDIAMKAVWPGGSRRHPTGGKYSRSGWVSLAGRGVEKVRLSGREALAGVRWESDGRSRLTVGQVKMER